MLKTLLSQNDLVFSSRSQLTHSIGRVDSFSRPEGKAAKVLGKKENSEKMHIYRISSENIMGRVSSTRSLQSSSEKDGDTSSSNSSSRCSISDDSRTYSMVDTEQQSDGSGLEMRKLSETSMDVKQPSTKPSRHMLVIPDTMNKQRVLEVKYEGKLPPLMNPDIPLVCPSPDSGVHDDFHSPTSMLKARNELTGLHSTSSSSVLSQSPSRITTVLGSKN